MFEFTPSQQWSDVLTTAPVGECWKGLSWEVCTNNLTFILCFKCMESLTDMGLSMGSPDVSMVLFLLNHVLESYHLCLVDNPEHYTMSVVILCWPHFDKQIHLLTTSQTGFSLTSDIVHFDQQFSILTPKFVKLILFLLTWVPMTLS